MSTSELKLHLIQHISKTNNLGQLKELAKLLGVNDEVYETLPEEKDAINKGLNDIAKGNSHSMKQVQKEVEAWLEK